MRKLYDQGCTACEWTGEIYAEPFTMPPCPKCAGQTERRWSRMSVRGDDIPGGMVIENMGHAPVTVYSKSQLRDEMRARGLEQRVKHVGTKGGDKSKFTTRWI